jgi:hypothetical protein
MRCRPRADPRGRAPFFGGQLAELFTKLGDCVAFDYQQRVETYRSELELQVPRHAQRSHSVYHRGEVPNVFDWGAQRSQSPPASFEQIALVQVGLFSGGGTFSTTRSRWRRYRCGSPCRL